MTGEMWLIVLGCCVGLVIGGALAFLTYCIMNVSSECSRNEEYQENKRKFGGDQ